MVREATVEIGLTTTADVRMPVGQTSEVVNVEAATAQIEYEKHAIDGVVTREQIAEVALGRPLNTFDRSVDVHVSRLRKKLGACPGTDELIRPIRGIGYFLAAEAPEKSRV